MRLGMSGSNCPQMAGPRSCANTNGAPVLGTTAARASSFCKLACLRKAAQMFAWALETFCRSSARNANDFGNLLRCGLRNCMIGSGQEGHQFFVKPEWPWMQVLAVNAQFLERDQDRVFRSSIRNARCRYRVMATSA